MGAHKHGGKKMRGGSAAVNAVGDILKNGCSKADADAAAKLGCKIGVSAATDCVGRPGGVTKCARELTSDFAHPLQTVQNVGQAALQTGEDTVNAIAHPLHTATSFGSTIVGGLKHIFGGKKHGKKTMKHKKMGKKSTKKHAKKGGMAHGKKHSKKTMKHAKKSGKKHGTRRH